MEKKVEELLTSERERFLGQYFNDQQKLKALAADYTDVRTALDENGRERINSETGEPFYIEYVHYDQMPSEVREKFDKAREHSDQSLAKLLVFDEIMAKMAEPSLISKRNMSLLSLEEFESTKIFPNNIVPSHVYKEPGENRNVIVPATGELMVGGSLVPCKTEMSLSEYKELYTRSLGEEIGKITDRKDVVSQACAAVVNAQSIPTQTVGGRTR